MDWHKTMSTINYYISNHGISRYHIIFAIFIIFVYPKINLAQDHPDSPKKRIVFLGNSITAGFGLTLEQAYPAIIQNKIDSLELNFDCVNAGLSGETTSGGLRRLDWLMKKPVSILIIALGGNDGLRGIPPDLSKENLEEMVKKARKKYPDIRIIIAGMEAPPNMGQDYTKKFRNIFKTPAEKMKTGYISFLLEGVGGRKELNQADQIHPNIMGQKLVAENVWNALKKFLN